MKGSVGVPHSATSTTQLALKTAARDVYWIVSRLATASSKSTERFKHLCARQRRVCSLSALSGRLPRWLAQRCLKRSV
jgi:hypothetical protein